MAKKTFKDSLDQFRSLSLIIKKADSFSPIYLLMGEEAFFIDKLEKMILKYGLSDEERDFNQTIYYGGKELRGGEISAAAYQCPVLSKRVLIVVREAQNITKIDELLQYAKSPSKTTLLVLCYKGKVMDKRTQLYKAIEKNGYVFESISPRSYEMSSIVKIIASLHNLTLDGKSEAMLVQYVGCNLSALDNELLKLSDTMPDDRRQVTDVDIEQKIGVSREYNVYELTSALSERDFNKALRIVENFASNPRQTPTQIIFPVLYTHFQRILELGVILWTSKKRNLPLPQDAELAKKLGLASPFFLKEYRMALGSYSTRSAFAILGMIRTYDMQTKGVGYNSTDDHELLRELIIKIMSLR